MFSVKQVALKLNCSDSFVYDRIADGSLKHYRLGRGKGGIRISEEQIREFLSGREHGGVVQKAPSRSRLARLKPLKNLSLE